MSLLVYPTIRGIGWPVKRNPTWDTDMQQASSGRVVKLAYWTNPLRQWEISYGGGNGGGEGYIKDNPNDLMELATETDLAILEGFYNQNQGRFGTFLYDDVTPGYDPGTGPWDYVAGQPMGSGDGTTTVFPLIRTIGGFPELIQAPFILDGESDPPGIQLNGIDQVYGTDFTIDGTGQAVFAVAPPSSPFTQITWTGSYYWPVRFDEDSIEFENMLQFLWSTKSIKLMQERL